LKYYADRLDERQAEEYNLLYVKRKCRSVRGEPVRRWKEDFEAGKQTLSCPIGSITYQVHISKIFTLLVCGTKYFIDGYQHLEETSVSVFRIRGIP
jgi:hypothetical protein